MYAGLWPSLQDNRKRMPFGRWHIPWYQDTCYHTYTSTAVVLGAQNSDENRVYTRANNTIESTLYFKEQECHRLQLPAPTPTKSFVVDHPYQASTLEDNTVGSNRQVFLLLLDPINRSQRAYLGPYTSVSVC